MKNTKKLFITALAVVAALGLTACSSNEKADAPSETASVFSTMETVDLKGNDVDGSIFADNKLTFVNTWNVGCTPCVQEIPHLDRLNDEYADKGVAFKGLYHNIGSAVSMEQRAEIETILADAEADYQQILISEDMYENKTIGGIQAFPTTFVVDSEGNIIDSFIGSNDYDGWKETVEKYLAQVEENE